MRAGMMCEVKPELLEEFWADWFGPGEHREIGNPSRYLAENPLDLITFARESPGPVFMSVNYYGAPNTVKRISALFYDFDCKEDIDRAWAEASDFAGRLRRFYGIEPLVCFSGSKGYHVYAFLEEPISLDSSQEHLKAIYGALQRMLLGNSKYETLDRAVLGDVKRLARVPYTRHEKSGQICQPVDALRRPVLLMPRFRDAYRKHGVSWELCRMAAEKVNEKALRRTPLKSRRVQKRRGVRPCLRAALERSEVDHKTRVAIVAELKAEGEGPGQIVDAFSGMRDFDRRRTEYQVGQVLKGNYSPFKCSTIQSLGGCLGSECEIYRRRRS